MCCHTSNKELRDIVAPDTIEKRYQRFGGIIHYVIPLDRVAVEGAIVQQESVLTHTSDAFLPGIDIEKIDEGKENISHFVLQYKVHYGGNTPSPLTPSFLAQTSNFILCNIPVL